MNEIWKDVIGYEGLYQVSNCGRVKSVTRYKKILTPHPDKDGYLYVKLKHNYTAKHARINRLVAEAFIPNPMSCPHVNHKDFNKQNNHVENLEWCTVVANINHSYSAGHYKGSHHKAVIQIFLDGNTKEFPSISEASRATNIPCSNIVKCCKGDRERAGGFRWEYRTEVFICKATDDF